MLDINKISIKNFNDSVQTWPNCPISKSVYDYSRKPEIFCFSGQSLQGRRCNVKRKICPHFPDEISECLSGVFMSFELLSREDQPTSALRTYYLDEFQGKFEVFQMSYRCFLGNTLKIIYEVMVYVSFGNNLIVFLLFTTKWSTN